VTAERFRVLLPAVWAGLLLTVGLIATPAPFAMLAPQDAGRVVARIFAQEAYVSLAFAALLFLIERRRARADAVAGLGSVLSGNLLLILGTLFCTVAGYFAVQPMMVAARAGAPGVPSFMTLHAVSMGFFALKGLLVIALAWRVTSRSS
jgi:hypothetical protein